MDWQTWIQQSLPRTENMRGGATVWPKGGERLIGDTLGPVMHLHDRASEIYYFTTGICRLEVGDTEEICQAGDFVLVPPETPHNFWNGGDEEVGVFWLVAPHFSQKKWRTEQITPEQMQARVHHVVPQPGRELPVDSNIHSRLISLERGLKIMEKTSPGQEAVIYVKKGEAEVLIGRLSGVLSTNEFVHVGVNKNYSIAAFGQPAQVFIFRTPANEP
jgi:quercetin dioxygenase-like cupin family protein